MVDSTKSFEVSNDGITIENENSNDGVWIGGGDSAPIHNAAIGSIYLRSDGDLYKQEGPSLNDWAVFSGGGGGTCEDFTKVSHGLSVGDVVRHGGTADNDFIKAQADTGVNSEAVGVVSEVDGDDFTVCYSGRVSGFTGLTPACVYFLSDTTPGAVTLTEPELSKPIFFATSATSAIVLIMRGTDADENGAQSIVVQNDDTTVGTTTEVLNFEGSGITSVTDDGANKTTVLIEGPGVHGTHRDYAEDDSDTGTTHQTFQTKLTLTTANLPSGQYRIGYSWEGTISSNAVVGEYRVTVGGVVIGCPTMEADSDWHQFGGFKVITLSGIKNIDIDYKSGDGVSSTRMRRARLEFWRVS